MLDSTAAVAAERQGQNADNFSKPWRKKLAMKRSPFP
jgi:hypothetical protein